MEADNGLCYAREPNLWERLSWKLKRLLPEGKCNSILHAERELDLLLETIPKEDTSAIEMQKCMNKHILHMVKEFSKEGHSGFSANYAIGIIEKLLKHEPVMPLTGEDWEWNSLEDYGDKPKYQNVRASRVFKDTNEDGSEYCYDIDGKVFWEWYSRPLAEDEAGYPGWSEPYKSYYTCRDSRTVVQFPYTPKTEYVYRYSDAEPRAPKQTEEGIIFDDRNEVQ